jgi:putative membrane protein
MKSRSDDVYALMPHLNAIFNTASAVLLAVGYLHIRRRNREAHRAFMLGALCSSTLFLVSYLVYHAHAGSVRYQGQGWIRTVYFTILISHTLLAAVVLPMVIVTLARALKGSFSQHRRLARWTFPVWIYVSLTGVLVYLLLYQL